jgi:uncharacterized protein YbjT (DUF2867 family)
MKIVVIGGSGLIGSRVVKNLTAEGREVLAASPKSGVDATTGQGLAQALAGAEVVVDVSNAPSWEDTAVLAFFEGAGRNLARAEKDAGVRHHVALSVVGTERLQESGYFRAKLAQERSSKGRGSLIRSCGRHSSSNFSAPSPIRAPNKTAFRLPAVSFQPMAAEDVARAVADAVLAPPVNGMIEIAGPERLPLSEFIARFLKATDDPREVASDPHALYYGIRVDDRSLVPGDKPHLGRSGSTIGSAGGESDESR